MTITTAMIHAWDRVRDSNAPPHHRRLPLDYAAWQAWRTAQGCHGETATRRLMELPDDAKNAYHVMVEAFMRADIRLPAGPRLPVWEVSC